MKQPHKSKCKKGPMTKLVVRLVTIVGHETECKEH